MEEPTKKELYKKLENVFLQIEDCLKLLEKQEEELHREVLSAIDREKMQKIKNRITNLKDF
ncbi:MAG TPA: hypothetical protein P5230_00830 [Candidatus Magasanikbacteria bacterium]|nr:hypothetical protein [Candidatus Magasanikbacteria bacterium]